MLELTRRTRQLLPEVTLSVTVPHTLPLISKSNWPSTWWMLVRIGFRPKAALANLSPGVQGRLKRPPYLGCSSCDQVGFCAGALRLWPVRGDLAPGSAAGAAGVGVGSAINRLSDELAMVAVVRGLRDALSVLNLCRSELPKVAA